MPFYMVIAKKNVSIGDRFLPQSLMPPSFYR